MQATFCGKLLSARSLSCLVTNRCSDVEMDLESDSEMHGECYRVAAGTTSRPVETNRKDRFRKVGFEIAVLNWPTLVQQRRESKLRRVGVEREPRSRREVPSQTP